MHSAATTQMAVDGDRLEMEISRETLGRRLVLSVGILLALMLILARTVQADGGISFGLKPAQEGIGYFTYSLGPGESVSDEIIVSNRGDVTVTLKLYAVDARTATNGGVIFPGGEGSTNTGAGAWVSLSMSRATLNPGTGVRLAFTFAVPEGARIGEHVAGIVAENTEPAVATSEEAQIVAQVIQRTALPIWETVPGPAVTDLQIGSVTHVVRAGSSCFDVELKNTGNVSIDGTDGELQVKDRAGAIIGRLPIQVTGRFLAGDAIVYPVNFEDLLPPGDYAVAVTADYEAPRPAVWESDFAVSKEEVSGASEKPLDRGFSLPTRGATGEVPGQVNHSTTLAIVIVVAAALIWAFLHRRRSSGTEPPQP
jgi:hypothetical protein